MRVRYLNHTVKMIAVTREQSPRNPTSNGMNPRHLLTMTAVGLMFVCAACSSRSSQGVLIPVAATAAGTSRVPVLAATTRHRSTADPGEMFNGERADGASYASIVVSIPPGWARKIAAIQWTRNAAEESWSGLCDYFGGLYG
jgi:hypothetical protein